MANPFVHVELQTNDPGSARKFYTSLFGWKLQDVPMPNGTYTMIDVGGGTGGGMMRNPVPGAPSSLIAEALSQSAVLLQWTDGSTNETEFRIEARSGAGAFAEVATVAANTVYATVEELAAATAHTFRVRARNASGFSPFSNNAAATTAAGATACVPDAHTACLLDGQH